ncbi:Rieske (2Fe-2S) protein [Lichenibacterium dinghuense]|uniref:Rieske (2Fe-2S) protein n=1 Tax=Lichenibacterium dinghuense TaxID=2895977 RepID=UPI001F2698D8|nr:Rieske (2Fe-2S) protein [Lichenibacterium sp. 6Y81]
MARYVVARLSEIPPGGSKLVDVEGRPIGIYNVDGNYFALLDRCPHEGASLCRGDRIGLVQSDGPGHYSYTRSGEMVRCPWHGWEFDIRTGQSWCDPKRMRVRAYAAAVAAGEELIKGPYVAESFPVSVDANYIVVDV